MFIALGVFGFLGFIGLIGLSLAIGTSTALAFLNQMESELPPVSDFEQLEFAQPTVVYDRTGTIELARFQIERRRVVAYEDIPKVLLDATIAVEDQTFWDNEGYDPNAIISAAIESILGEGDRGASTITQQLVRARLLPDDVLQGWVDKHLAGVQITLPDGTPRTVRLDAAIARRLLEHFAPREVHSLVEAIARSLAADGDGPICRG